MTASDADLMRSVHDQHARALRAYVLGLTNGDSGRADDVVQETLLRAWRRPGILAQADGPIRGWLFTVARRIVIDEWRSARTRPETLTDSPPEASSQDLAEVSTRRSVVVQALRLLSEDHRRVLLECYIGGATVAEAAQRLGVPEGTVKSRTHYAVKAFKLAMEEIGGL